MPLVNAASSVTPQSSPLKPVTSHLVACTECYIWRIPRHDIRSTHAPWQADTICKAPVTLEDRFVKSRPFKLHCLVTSL